MAEAVFREMVKKEKLSDKIIIDSAATSSWEHGNPVHHGTKTRLAKEGISVKGMYSRILNKIAIIFKSDFKVMFLFNCRFFFLYIII